MEKSFNGIGKFEMPINNQKLSGMVKFTLRTNAIRRLYFHSFDELQTIKCLIKTYYRANKDTEENYEIYYCEE